MSGSSPLLTVNQLKKNFPIKSGVFGRKVIKKVHAVSDVSFNLNKGETFGVVGESGCGKSTVARLILRLIEPTSGEIHFDGKNLLNLSKQDMRNVRKDLQIIFQDPFASLNPRMKIGDIIQEPMDNFNLYTLSERRKKVDELLEQVGLSSKHAKRFPHEFSGGQRQRVGIARALASNPKLIVADEAVSALDVSVQSQILNLMKDLQKEHGLTYLFISHDLSVIKHLCNRIGVMYLGKLVELGSKQKLYHEPLHPYTKSLLSAVPVPNPKVKKERIVLSGDVPSPSNPPTGCAFHPRCPMAMDICKEQSPIIQESDGQLVACHLYTEEQASPLQEVDSR